MRRLWNFNSGVGRRGVRAHPLCQQLDPFAKVHIVPRNCMPISHFVSEYRLPFSLRMRTATSTFITAPPCLCVHCRLGLKKMANRGVDDACRVELLHFRTTHLFPFVMVLTIPLFVASLRIFYKLLKQCARRKNVLLQLNNPPWIWTIFSAFTQRLFGALQLDPTDHAWQDASPRVETWFSDHTRLRSCHFTRVVTLGPAVQFWENQLRSRWQDYIDPNVDVDFVIVYPMPADAHPGFSGASHPGTESHPSVLLHDHDDP